MRPGQRPVIASRFVSALSYVNILVQALKLLPPTNNGTTTNVPAITYPYNARANTITIYNGVVIKAEYFALNHQGYIYPDVSGTYTFTTSLPDDLIEVWVGDLAYSGWTRANAQLEQNSGLGPQGYYTPQVYTVDLVAGQYYPLRKSDHPSTPR